MTFSNKDLIKLVLPLMAEQVLAACMGIADTLMVSNVSPAALSGVSLVDTISNIMICLFSAMAAGGTIVCSQYIGRGERKIARRAGEQVILSCFVIAVVLCFICVGLRRPLLKLIYGSIDADVMEAALIYILITGCSYPFLALSQASGALLRAEGRTKLTMDVAIVTNVMNVIGNAVGIFVLNKGVYGAAVSTLVSRITGAVILLIVQRNPELILSVRDYLKIRPDGKMIRQILRIGVPTGLENTLFNLGKLIVASTVSMLGTVAIASQAITMTLDSIHSMPAQAANLALITVAGQTLGAGKKEECRCYTKKLCLWVEVLLIATTIILIPLLGTVFKLAKLTDESAALSFKLCLLIFLSKIPLYPFSFTLPNTLRAAGDVRYATLVSTVSMWVIRVALSTALCRRFGFGLEGIWYSWILDWGVRSILYYRRYQSGKWERKKVID